MPGYTFALVNDNNKDLAYSLNKDIICTTGSHRLFLRAPTKKQPLFAERLLYLSSTFREHHERFPGSSSDMVFLHRTLDLAYGLKTVDIGHRPSWIRTSDYGQWVPDFITGPRIKDIGTNGATDLVQQVRINYDKWVKESGIRMNDE